MSLVLAASKDQQILKNNRLEGWRNSKLVRHIRALGDEPVRDEHHPRTTWEGAQKSWAPLRPKDLDREARHIRSTLNERY